MLRHPINKWSKQLTLWQARDTGSPSQKMGSRTTLVEGSKGQDLLEKTRRDLCQKTQQTWGSFVTLWLGILLFFGLYGGGGGRRFSQAYNLSKGYYDYYSACLIQYLQIWSNLFF